MPIKLAVYKHAFPILYEHQIDREILEIIEKPQSCNKTVHNTADMNTFTPPQKKNVVFTVGVKSISKMSFLRSMGSTKKSVSYGAWEAHF